jgi:hypothetical protein
MGAVPVNPKQPLSQDLTRKDLLSQYRFMRLAVRRITSLAVEACSKTDMTRAAKQLLIWTGQGMPAIEDDETVAMLCDIALFEPNQRRRLAFDTFYHGNGQHIEDSDRALAAAMTATRFSLFCGAGKHEVAGVWLVDILDADRRLWVMDESLEKSLPPGTIFGMRLFDAGRFYMGCGIIVEPDEETIQMCVASQRSSGRHPFRHSLAATLYGDELRTRRPPGPEQDRLIEALMNSFGSRPAQPKKPR